MMFEKIQDKIYGSKIKIKGIGNVFDKNLAYKNKLNLFIDGTNNRINISSTAKLNKISIIIFGDNNIINIADNVNFGSKHNKLSIGYKNIHRTNNSIISIGNKTLIGSSDMLVYENNSRLLIGSECMFSTGIMIRTSDTHSVLDENNSVINKGNYVEIGDRVWVGVDVKIGKNVRISNNSIIGWGSVVTKGFSEEKVVIAGNPARVVKNEVHWASESPDIYIC